MEIIYDAEVLSTVGLDIIVDYSVIIETKTIIQKIDKEINQVQRYKNITGLSEA